MGAIKQAIKSNRSIRKDMSKTFGRGGPNYQDLIMERVAENVNEIYGEALDREA